MHISRKEAKTLVSFIQLFGLDEGGKQQLFETIQAESGSSMKLDSIHTQQQFRKYLFHQLKHVSNDYLEKTIFQRMGQSIVVQGRNKARTCACCGYKTVGSTFEYEVCPICFWEQDGTSDEDKLSSVNAMTLGEARKSFDALGVINTRFLGFVSPNRFAKFEK